MNASVDIAPLAFEVQCYLALFRADLLWYIEMPVVTAAYSAVVLWAFPAAVAAGNPLTSILTQKTC